MSVSEGLDIDVLMYYYRGIIIYFLFYYFFKLIFYFIFYFIFSVHNINIYIISCY